MITFEKEYEYEVASNSSQEPNPYEFLDETALTEYVMDYIYDSDEYYDEDLLDAMANYNGDMMRYISFELDEEPHRSWFGGPDAEIWTYFLYIEFDDELFRMENM